MNRTLLTRVLVDVHHFSSDALHAAKQGLETQALVSAEAALNRLSALLSTYKNALPPQSTLPCVETKQLFTSNGN